MMYVRKTSVVVSLLVLSALIVGSIPAGDARMKAYYQGDAISFNGHMVVATTNTDKVEIFALENDRLFKKSTIKSPDYLYTKFHDVLLMNEAGKLKGYFVNGYLNIYDLSDLSRPVLEKTIKDPAWDYYFGVAKNNNKVVTIGSKAIKVWNKTPDVIDSFPIKVKNSRNVKFSNGGQYMYVVIDDKLSVINTLSHAEVMSKDIVASDDHQRSFYIDADNNAYIVDDGYFRKITMDGVVSTYKHKSIYGYDVSPSADGKSIYFTDGIGIMKSKKSDVSEIDWAFTKSMGEPDGWAMGMKAVSTDKGERIVVFNGTSILILNSNLNFVAFYPATEPADPAPTEKLALKLDKNHAAANSQVMVSGTGFAENEDLVITMGGVSNSAIADQRGRFVQIITVPNITPGWTDIKVTGKTTKLHYSISFRVE